MPFAASLPYSALYLLGSGAAALCLASLATMVSVGGWVGLSPGRRAMAHWAPIAVAAVTACVLGQYGIAIGIVFGTSVAVMSTGVGSLCAIAPVGPAPARWKRLWSFTLAAALLVFVCGFSGQFTWKQALALLIQGLVVLSLWHDGGGHPHWAGPERPPASQFLERLGWVGLIASPFLAAAGAWLAVGAADGMSHYRVVVTPMAIGASLLSLVLAMPIAQAGRAPALNGTSWLPMTANAGVVMLNLCVLLPLVALMPYAIALKPAMHFSRHRWIYLEGYAPQPMPFPLAVWRIDAVALIVLCTLLLPVGAGKWNLGRGEGAVLIAAYCVYLMAVTVAGV